MEFKYIVLYSYALFYLLPITSLLLEQSYRLAKAFVTDTKYRYSTKNPIFTKAMISIISSSSNNAANTVFFSTVWMLILALPLSIILSILLYYPLTLLIVISIIFILFSLRYINRLKKARS